LTADGRPRHEVPYLHVRAPKRVGGVGGEGEPVARITGNRAALLALREQVDQALKADEGLAVETTYREADERRFDLWVMRAHRRAQMGEPREPERPDRSRFT